MNSENTLYDVKRIIGRPWDDEVVQSEAKNFPFTLEDGEIGPTMTAGAARSATWPPKRCRPWCSRR